VDAALPISPASEGDGWVAVSITANNDGVVRSHVD
jgi:hypothetical protein